MGMGMYIHSLPEVFMMASVLKAGKWAWLVI